MKKKTVNIYSFILTVIFYLLLHSCDKSTNPVNNETAGKIVTDNITEIAPFTEISELKKGTRMKLRVNRDGFLVHEYPITFEGVYQVGEERLIICLTPKEVIIGSGDSGSPVFTEDNRVAGVVCYGFTGVNNQCMARAIEDLLTLGGGEGNSISKHLSSMDGSNLFEPIEPSYFVIGYDEDYARLYTGSNNIDPFSEYYKINNVYLNKKSMQKNKQRTDFTQDTLLIPGMSTAVLQVYGDLVIAGAVGTASYISADHEIFAFGHEFNASLYYGPVAAPCFIADMKTMVESSYRSQKLAVPTSVQIGALTKDDYFGILIDEDIIPATFPVITFIDIDSKGVQNFSHMVANDKSPQEDHYLAGYVSTYPVYREIIRSGAISVNARGTIEVTLESTVLDSTFEIDSEDNREIPYQIWDIIDYLLASTDQSITGVELNIEVDIDK